MPVDGRTKRVAAPASLSGSLATCAHESRDWGRRRGAPSGVTDLTGSAEVFAIGHGSRGRFAYSSAASTAKTALCAVRRLFAAHDKGWTDQCTVSFEREGFTVVAFHAADGMLVSAATVQLSQSRDKPPTFVIRLAATEEQRRRQGYMQAVLAGVRQAADLRGARDLFLEVSALAGASRYWEKHGHFVVRV